MVGKRAPAEIRFNAFTEKTDDHWLWKGYRLPNGYGRFSYNCKTVYAHHYAWFSRHGRWPRKDERVIHACKTVFCVNPEHLVVKRKVK